MHGKTADGILIGVVITLGITIMASYMFPAADFNPRHINAISLSQMTE
jgi:hypothetical protein